MKPFRQKVAIAIDGGGIKGTMVARALMVLEEHLDAPSREIFRLAAGTSTGSILSAGIALGLRADALYDLYTRLGHTIFSDSFRSMTWPILSRYRYPHAPLERALERHFGDPKMSELWDEEDPFDLVITAFDLTRNRTCFIKPWKEDYAEWRLIDAVLSSCSVPTYFPAVDGRYVDGGVGSYSNPCYLAAYELVNCLGWDPAETTLISLGTGRDPHHVKPGEANRWMIWDWLKPILGAFLQCADDQQVHLVSEFFTTLDFRRFQVDLEHPIAMDDADAMPALTRYGEMLGHKILNDEIDDAIDVAVPRAPGFDSDVGISLEAGR